MIVVFGRLLRADRFRSFRTLVVYLNILMAETVLRDDATEDEVNDAYDEHLVQPVEIVEYE